jgi:hypothetical protein
MEFIPQRHWLNQELDELGTTIDDEDTDRICQI